MGHTPVGERGSRSVTLSRFSAGATQSQNPARWVRFLVSSSDMIVGGALKYGTVRGTVSYTAIVLDLVSSYEIVREEERAERKRGAPQP